MADYINKIETPDGTVHNIKDTTKSHFFVDGSGEGSVKPYYGVGDIGAYSFAEGLSHNIVGSCCHAEGRGNTVGKDAIGAHVEGFSNTVITDSLCSHVEGSYNTATSYCYVCGNHNVANDVYSEMYGSYNVSNSKYSLTIGKYSSSDSAIFKVGYGTSTSARKDIVKVDQDNHLFTRGYMNAYIGEVREVSLTSDKNAATAKNVEVCHLSLNPGIWFIEGRVRFASNSNGRRICSISTTSATDADHLMFPACGSGVTQMVLSRYSNLTATTTLYLNAYQDSGSTISISSSTTAGWVSGIRATRIA